MLLQHATWPEVEAYLEANTGIIVPIGSTEQHGPSGLIGTDALTAELIGRRVGEVTASFVAPTLNYGMAQHHMAFTGTMTLQPSTMIAVVRDLTKSLIRHGFSHIFFVNGHGGNVNSVKVAFSEVQSELAEMRSMRDGDTNHPPEGVHLELHNWWAGERTTSLRKSLYGDREGYHATPSEVAVTWYSFPDQQRNVELGPLEKVTRAYQGPEDFRKLFPDGRMGSDPSLATPEDGKRLVSLAVDELSDLYRKFLAET
ncbi:MAG: Creatinine amidohydrolase [Alphaproteobacteria bacterium MarineAlpha4_Bin2]|nr:MAG: Creatinine amidohydrolase [Alphaproteobacteria bacterium MarineAlpha4_Bin2]